MYTADIYKMYTKCIKMFVKMWDAFYIHIVCINSDLQKVYIKKSMYTKLRNQYVYKIHTECIYK